MKDNLKKIGEWIIERTCENSTTGNYITTVEEVEEEFQVQLSDHDIDTINILMSYDERVLCVSEPEDEDFNIIVGSEYCPEFEDIWGELPEDEEVA